MLKFQLLLAAVGIAILVATYAVIQWTSRADERIALEINHATCVAQLRVVTPATSQSATEVARALEICGP
ncbi:MAG: hypothetical protein EPO22_12035 [Dehalococcoidia bacterium]|nr:MAG: hypothetical protein EPO22_12035 [Dehalococcoidia bacterium]